MGLLVVARLAQRHGVQVRLESVPAGGTTATVVIPDRLVMPLSSVDRLQSGPWVRELEQGPQTAPEPATTTLPLALPYGTPPPCRRRLPSRGRPCRTTPCRTTPTGHPGSGAPPQPAVPVTAAYSGGGTVYGSPALYGSPAPPSIPSQRRPVPLPPPPGSRPVAGVTSAGLPTAAGRPAAARPVGPGRTGLDARPRGHPGPAVQSGWWHRRRDPGSAGAPPPSNGSFAPENDSPDNYPQQSTQARMAP